MADCYQENCPWRRNETSSIWRCECVACPNRDDGVTTWFTANTTGKLGDGRMSVPNFGGTGI